MCTFSTTYLFKIHYDTTLTNIKAIFNAIHCNYFNTLSHKQYASAISVNKTFTRNYLHRAISVIYQKY